MALIDIAAVFNAATTDPIFRRFQAACLVAAKDIKAESSNTPNHEQRVGWADAVLQLSPGESAFRVYRHLRYAIATNSAFQAAGDQVTDNDIQFIVNSQIDILL